MANQRRRAYMSDRPGDMSPELWRYLLDQGECSESYFVDVEALWRRHNERLLAEFTADRPGERPRLWWEYDAPRQPAGTYPLHVKSLDDGRLPEPRQRLGGVGDPAWERLAYKPLYDRGIPAIWVDPWEADYYGFEATVAIDPDDPPAFESQAAYLARHGLLLPGERDRLPEDAFEPTFIYPTE